jgi:hypothetical protein
MAVKCFLANSSVLLINHLPYLPDLAAAYFFLFLEVKTTFTEEDFRCRGCQEECNHQIKCSFFGRLS